jgi:hypothetical protein
MNISVSPFRKDKGKIFLSEPLPDEDYSNYIYSGKTDGRNLKDMNEVRPSNDSNEVRPSNDSNDADSSINDPSQVMKQSDDSMSSFQQPTIDDGPSVNEVALVKKDDVFEDVLEKMNQAPEPEKNDILEKPNRDTIIIDNKQRNDRQPKQDKAIKIERNDRMDRQDKIEKNDRMEKLDKRIAQPVSQSVPVMPVIVQDDIEQVVLPVNKFASPVRPSIKDKMQASIKEVVVPSQPTSQSQNLYPVSVNIIAKLSSLELNNKTIQDEVIIYSGESSVIYNHKDIFLLVKDGDVQLIIEQANMLYYLKMSEELKSKIDTSNMKQTFLYLQDKKFTSPLVRRCTIDGNRLGYITFYSDGGLITDIHRFSVPNTYLVIEKYDSTEKLSHITTFTRTNMYIVQKFEFETAKYRNTITLKEDLRGFGNIDSEKGESSKIIMNSFGTMNINYDKDGRIKKLEHINPQGESVLY